MKACRILAILVITVLVVGCGERESSDYLGYQQEGGQFLCKISRENTVYRAMLEIENGMSLTFQEPKALEGYRFTQTDGGIVLRYGGLELSVPDAELPRRLFALFSLSPGDFLSASREKISGEEITVVHFVGDRLLRLAPDGRPLMLEDDALTVDILSVSKPGT